MLYIKIIKSAYFNVKVALDWVSMFWVIFLKGVSDVIWISKLWKSDQIGKLIGSIEEFDLDVCLCISFQHHQINDNYFSDIYYVYIFRYHITYQWLILIFLSKILEISS